MPDTKAEELEYRCWCQFRGTYADRDEHRATHKAKKKGDKK